MLIQNLLDEHLKKQRDKPRERSGKWNPSSLGKCYRAQYWKRMNQPESNPPDKRTFRVFAVGTLFHEWLQKAICLEDKNASCEVEIRTPDVVGFADMVIGDTVVEFKTQHSRAFWYMKKEGYDIITQKFEHCLQGMWYCKQLIKPKLKLVYISKDDLCIEEYDLDYTDFWKLALEKELQMLNKYWDKEELPPVEPRCYKNKEGKSKECQYCGFADLCEEKEEVEV